MRAGHFTVRLNLANGGFLKFTFQSAQPFTAKSFMTGQGLVNVDGSSALDDEGHVCLILGPREIAYDPKEVVTVDMFPAKSDPSRQREHGDWEREHDDGGQPSDWDRQQDRGRFQPNNGGYRGRR